MMNINSLVEGDSQVEVEVKAPIIQFCGFALGREEVGEFGGGDFEEGTGDWSD
jgi:hypothetical protein